MIITNDSLKIKELKHYSFTDYNNCSDKIDDYLSSFSDEILELLPEDFDVTSADFLLYELLTNVYKHSKFENAYEQIITDNNAKNIDICIFDNGIGIPESFKSASMSSVDDCEAIYEAINGKTSDKEKYNLRGRGLNSSARLITLGFNGEMLIASGNGVCAITEDGARTYLNQNYIKGTFVIMQIENKKVDNIYNYLKFEHINKLKEDNHDPN